VQLPDVTTEQKPSTGSRAAVTASTGATAQPETSQTAAAKVFIYLFFLKTYLLNLMRHTGLASHEVSPTTVGYIG